MAKQVRTFGELVQPSDFDYEGWLEELPRGAVKNSDMPKEKEFQISSLISSNDIGSPEEDSDPSSGSNVGPSQRKSKGAKYDNHTTQHLEEFITRNPCPDEIQKDEVARQLHLTPKQIKYWIQNYKIRKRVKFARDETNALKEEISKLHAKLKWYEEALSNTTCSDCGGPGNANKSLDYRSQVPEADPNVGKGKLPCVFPEVFQQMRKDFLHTKDGQDLVAKLVVAAMEELVMMGHEGAPLWIPTENDAPLQQSDILNKEEYLRIFPRDPNHAPKKLWPETSRDSAVVLMEPFNIVKILMDAKQWSTVFGNIVSKARTLEILAVGIDESFNEALHEITAEFHLPSPLVPVREHHFIRYCHRYYEDLWVVVDTDISGVFQDPNTKSYRRPSGCLIQSLQDGYSKVTWVENAEVDDEGIQNLYFPLIKSGIAFGAKRWVSTLEGQCQRLVSSMVTPHDPISLGVIYNDKGKEGLCNLAERMMLKFHSDVSASAANHWSTSSECFEFGEIQSMVKVNTIDPGVPMGTIFSAVSSLWSPTSPNEVSELLQNYQSRHQWDILAKGEVVEEVMHITTNSKPGNYISLLRINGTNPGTVRRLILQESCRNSVESYLVYTKINTLDMKAVLSGANPDFVTLLPSGFAILPIEAAAKGVRGRHGSSTNENLLTIAVQKVVHWGRNLKNFKKPLSEAKKQIRAIIAGIKAATLK